MKASKFNQFELVIALCAFAANAFAASPICVSNTSDAGDGSLRAAITQANEAGGGEITFCITNSITNTITLLSALPSLTANITIIGPGTNLLTISGGNQVRVFSMDSGTTNTLSGLTIADGMALSYPTFTYASGISNAGSLQLLNCVVQTCSNAFSYGAGIYNAGDMEMETSVVADCGGFYTRGSSDMQGGGIYNSGTLRMTNCRISRCEADVNSQAGGGICNAGNLTISASVIESCQARGQGDGGGIWNGGTAAICGCTMSNCAAFWGGGIESYGTLAMTNSTVVENLSFGIGGGLNIGKTTNWLVGCTIAENDCYGDGGGIFNDGSELWMLNCTVSGNSAYDGNGGGIGQGLTGLYGLRTIPTIYANHCTIVSNTLSGVVYGGSAGGGVWNEQGVFDCQNSIIADNGTNDVSGVLISEGYNLIQNTNGCTITNNETGDIYGVDPRLGPLQDNGGRTWTHALLAGSPAIDQGTSGGLTTDQRGVRRPYDVPTVTNAGDGSDIGAYEWTPPPAACDMAAQTVQNQPLTIAAAKLLLCASSPTGCPLTLSGVSANSTNGGTVVLAGDAVTYTPTTNFIGADLFTYTISDGWGGTAAGEMAVSVIAGNAPSSNMLPPVYAPGGLLVSFAGIIGRTYSVQCAPATMGPWATIGTATVGPTGIGSFEDTNPPPGSAFYRTAFP